MKMRLSTAQATAIQKQVYIPLFDIFPLRIAGDIAIARAFIMPYSPIPKPYDPVAIQHKAMWKNYGEKSKPTPLTALNNNIIIGLTDITYPTHARIIRLYL
jgi:hypothetical protein